MSSANERGSSKDGGEGSAGKPQPEGAQPIDRGFLDQVLNRAFQGGERPSAEVESATLDELRRIAKTYQGHPLTVEPVAVELVHAVLARRAIRGEKPESWQKMLTQVAESLFDDPASKERLEAFWARLCEASQ
jgi:hypothetical protein